MLNQPQNGTRTDLTISMAGHQPTGRTSRWENMWTPQGRSPSLFAALRTYLSTCLNPTYSARHMESAQCEPLGIFETHVDHGIVFLLYWRCSAGVTPEMRPFHLEFQDRPTAPDACANPWVAHAAQPPACASAQLTSHFPSPGCPSVNRGLIAQTLSGPLARRDLTAWDAERQEQKWQHPQQKRQWH